MVDELNHRMIRLLEPRIAGIVRSAVDSNVTGTTVYSFEFGAHRIEVATVYSVFDWKRLLETGDEKRERRREKRENKHENKKSQPPIRLPFAHIQPLKCHVALDGDLLGTKGSTLHLKEYHGKQNTTLNDIVLWYSKVMISNVPGFVSNADVLGINLKDTVAGQVGTSAGASALASTLGAGAAPVASMLGVVGFDVVKNTINAGKRSRGAENDDKAGFGDFFRGIGQAAKEATAGGAARRGKSSNEKADAIDWALGATMDVGSYTNKNKSRLGGAGAGSVGFMYGLALGGPVGAVAGAIIAGKATSSTIDRVDHEIAKGKKQEQKAAPS